MENKVCVEHLLLSSGGGRWGKGTHWDLRKKKFIYFSFIYFFIFNIIIFWVWKKKFIVKVASHWIQILTPPLLTEKLEDVNRLQWNTFLIHFTALEVKYLQQREWLVETFSELLEKIEYHVSALLYNNIVFSQSYQKGPMMYYFLYDILTNNLSINVYKLRAKALCWS